MSGGRVGKSSWRLNITNWTHNHHPQTASRVFPYWATSNLLPVKNLLDEATCRAILFPIAGPGAFNPQSFQRNWYETIISISKVFHGKVRRTAEIGWNRMKSVKMTEISVEHGNPGRNVICLVFEGSRFRRQARQTSIDALHESTNLATENLWEVGTYVWKLEKVSTFSSTLKSMTNLSSIWQRAQVFSTAWDESCETACLKRCFSCTRLPSQDLEASWVSDGRLCGTMLSFAGCRIYIQ